jgi:fucose 4-O-acetylase-like acetyltransferase
VPDSRLAWVDAAKGLSILLVVVHHTVTYLQTAGLAPAPVVVGNEALASLRMPLFFLAAGLFVAGPLAAPWRPLLHKRVAFFLYLYLLWTLIRFTFFATLVPPAVDPNDSANPESLVWALLLPGPSMWFLYALALFSVIGKLVRRVPAAVQLGLSGVLSALTGAGLLEFDSRWGYMARFLFFFLLGWHAKVLIERLARSTSLLKVVAAAGACVLCAVGAVALQARPLPGVALALNCVAVVFGVLFTAWICRYRIGSPLVLLGQQTLPVYLVHMLWLAAIMTGLRHVEVPPVVGYVLPVVLAVVLVALALLTHRVLVALGATALFALPSALALRTRSPRHRVPAQRGESSRQPAVVREAAPTVIAARHRRPEPSPGRPGR